MFYYEMGYGSPEDSEVVTLMHKRSFRKHEYNKMIYDCSMDAARIYFTEEQKQFKEIRESKDNHGTRREYMYEDKHIRISYTDIYEKVAELMCERYGFERPKVKQSWLAMGWDNLRNNNDWKSYGANARLQNKISRAIIDEFGAYEDTSIAYKK